MDILAIQPSTISVDIKHPATGAPTGLTVECVSLEDDRVKQVERQIKNRALRGGRNTVTAEKIEDNTAEILSAAVVGWKWEKPLLSPAKGKKAEVYGEQPDLDGDPNPPLTKINVSKLLAAGWIAKQIDTALGDEAAFFAK